MKMPTPYVSMQVLGHLKLLFGPLLRPLRWSTAALYCRPVGHPGKLTGASHVYVRNIWSQRPAGDGAAGGGAHMGWFQRQGQRTQGGGPGQHQGSTAWDGGNRTQAAGAGSVT